MNHGLTVCGTYKAPRYADSPTRAVQDDITYQPSRGSASTMAVSSHRPTPTCARADTPLHIPRATRASGEKLRAVPQEIIRFHSQGRPGAFPPAASPVTVGRA